MKSKKVGDYILGSRIGSGNRNEVILAVHETDGKQFVAKKIKKVILEGKPKSQLKIRYEIALLSLLDHPHVTKLIDVLESSSNLYIIFEYARKGELLDYLIERKNLQIPEALYIFREMVYGLDYLHNHNIGVDLKPEKILLDEFGHVKLSVFGFTEWWKSNLAERGVANPCYIAPEVILGQLYDKRSANVWSCGVILYSLLTGRLPFDEPSIRTLLMKIKKGAFNMPELPDSIQDLISRMLTVSVEKRITIREIQNHPAFQIGLPDNYIIPKQLQIRHFKCSIDPSTVGCEFFVILKNLGYNNDEEIKQDLIKPSFTAAKAYYLMFDKSFAYKSIEWTNSDSDDQREIFNKDPQINCCLNDQIERKFDRNFVVIRPNWFVVVSHDLNNNEERNLEHEFKDIQIKLEYLMKEMQLFLTKNDFKWFHKSDIELIVKSSKSDMCVILTCSYQSIAVIKLNLMLIQGTEEQFNEFIREINTCISSPNQNENQ